MAKKKNSKAGSERALTPASKPRGPVVSEPVPGNIAMNFPIHSFSLVIGSWKKRFSEHQYKIVIAQALNDCTRKGILTIGGYIITSRRLCLVLEIYETEILPTLQLFYDSVRKEIRQHLEWLKRGDRIKDRHDLITIDDSYTDLFIPYPLFNEPLIRLITGRSVKPGYYDPHLARLKDRVLGNNFCSARDYAGAEGPVYVRRITQEEWAAEYRRIHKEHHKKF